MKKLTGEEIRQMWMDFWKGKGHDIYPSASLVPDNDPTLLWMNSGVAALKHYLDGSEVPENPRIANAQKCIRTNDIENVGVTARHQTFFEMLGNWSVGDYFKEEVIPWAWEFLTDEKWLGLDPELLYMTYYPDDDVSHGLWQKVTGLSEDHFVSLEDNFWDLGAGPCGPDTEIFFDRGKAYQDLDDDDPEMFPGGENERYLEIWNIVFSEFNHMPDGSYEKLKQHNVDTGMGLERIASVLQETPTNFETDLLFPLIKEVEKLSDGKKYGESKETDTAMKVIADHIRAVSFAVGDNALPSNEGRGYILRRLIRRSVMYGRRLGIQGSFLAKLVPIVADKMEKHYPELKEKEAIIQEVVDREEKRFQETIADGENIIKNKIAELEESGENSLDGQSAFKLYDTYGFPLELTEEYLAETGFSVDINGFNQAMEQQKERARAARKDQGGLAVQSTVLGEIDVPSHFTGYEEDVTETKINAIVYQDEISQEAPANSKAYFIAEKTPFYGERGGQVGDSGKLYNLDGELLGYIRDTKHAPNDQNLHYIDTVQPISVGQEVRLEVDSARRRLIRNNHTATHLLHRVLKDVLGEQVNQAGSLLDEHYLRFDFTYFGQVSSDQLEEVERRVNEKIWEQIPVETIFTTVKAAKEHGAIALFGEKYLKLHDEIRVINIDDWSMELCGGTHVKNTGFIGLFKIISESGIGSGVRRIEALTSKAAYEYYEAKLGLLNQVRDDLKVKKAEDVPHRLQQLEGERKSLESEVESLHAKANQMAASQIFDAVKESNGVRYIAEELDHKTMDDLRAISDEWKQNNYSDVLVLATANGDKANMLVAVSADKVKEGLKAGDIIKGLAPYINGGGGGRPELAQAGGKNPAGIPDALKALEEVLNK
ncbi:alanine--tRNA ligase [Aerococcus tenax]|uniref:alanine--tRNA ligase n=1 Tax=Aerococcus tenax TaxID=3078812 RepID=UPI0018A72BCA|nr:alanine--tRNA ligase [Aerococcus tenax]